MWNWFRSTYYCLLLLTKSNVLNKLLIMGILLGDTIPCNELYKLKCQQLSFASSSNAMALFSAKNYFVIHSNRWIWLNFIPKMCVLTYCCSHRVKQKKINWSQFIWNCCCCWFNTLFFSNRKIKYQPNAFCLHEAVKRHKITDIFQ